MGNQQGSPELKDLIAVPYIDGYFVDGEGEIYSTKRGGIKKLTQHQHYGRGRKPYRRLKVVSNCQLSHRVIASVIVGRQLRKDEVVNHKNGDTLDNRLSNLEVLSQRDNVKHAVLSGLYCQGDAWHKARMR